MAARGQSVIINEVFAATNRQANASTFVELHNRGTEAVSLHSWSLSKAVGFTFTNVSIPAGGYLAVAADRDALLRAHPSVTNVVGNWTGRLSANGETIELLDPFQRVVSAVEYGSDGDWAVRVRGPLDHGHRGWTWAAAFENGRSLERVDSSLLTDAGANWAASEIGGGTPGRPNSVATINPGVILEVVHSPAVPRSTNDIAITARIVSRSAATQVTLLYRRDGGPGESFRSVPMFDDGSHGDGASVDGVFGAVVPPQPPGTVLEYYVELNNLAGASRTWPLPAVLETGERAQIVNCLLQVDDEVEAAERPLYRLILTEAERAELALIGRQLPDALTEAEFNATFVAWDGGRYHIRHRTGLRHRGHGSRGKPPNSYHIAFPEGAQWNGATALNLNAPYSYVQALGNAFCLRAGLHAPWTYLASVRVNGFDHAFDGGAVLTYGAYAAVEVLNADFAKRHFPEDDEGNLYRGIGSDDTTQEADFRDLGPDPIAYQPVYSKENNRWTDDWSDLIALSQALSSSAETNYLAAVADKVHVRDWIRYLAVMAFMDNQETSPNTGTGDDFALYCGAKDPRFYLLPYDTDTILGQGIPAGKTNATFLGSLKIAALDRFLSHPEHARQFVADLRQLAASVFAPERAFPMLDHLLGAHVPPPVLESVRRFIVGRAQQLSAQFPDGLSAFVELSETNGVYQTGAASLALSGQADAAVTAEVRVNGSAARWEPLRSAWSVPAVALHAGLNAIVVQAFGPEGTELARLLLQVRRDAAGLVVPAGTVLGDVEWTAADGAIRLPGNVTVPEGRTLTLGPGCAIEFAPGANLVVHGRLVAVGTAESPIQLALPDALGTTAGLRFQHSAAWNELRHAHLLASACDQPVIQLDHSRLALEEVQFGPANHGAIRSVYSSLSINACSFSPAVSCAATIEVAGSLPGFTDLLIESSRFAASEAAAPAISLNGVRSGKLAPRVKNCVFLGGTGNGLDVTGSDVYLEGNQFEGFRVRADGQLEANAVAARYGSMLTAIRNLFAANDAGALIESGSYLVSEHNTWVRHADAALRFQAHPGSAEIGRGATVTGDIFWGNGSDVRAGEAVEFKAAYSFIAEIQGAGLINAPGAEPGFVSGDARFSLASYSVCRGRSREGLDLGWDVPPWAMLAGIPEDGGPSAQATIRVQGPGLSQYRYRVDGGEYGLATPVEEPILLRGLAAGVHRVEVIARNRAGEWQSEEEHPTVAVWRVEPAGSTIVISEVLASNADPLLAGPSLPDIIELFNRSDNAVDLTELSLSDNADAPGKFTFRSGPLLPPGGFAVLVGGRTSFGNAQALGFSLKAGGDQLFLFDSASRGQGILDSIRFGRQLSGYSIARFAGGQWALAFPTFGQANLRAPIGDGRLVRINEWFAYGVSSARDFIELFNPNFVPVDLSGFTLTVLPGAAPIGHRFPELTFLGAHEPVPWLGAGGDVVGNDELSFKLSKEAGLIRLFDAADLEVDAIAYQHQAQGYSEGRSPTGADAFARFADPGAGALNPGEQKLVTSSLLNLVTITNRWRFNQSGADLGAVWKEFEYDDSTRGWSSGRGLFYLGATNGLPAGLGTSLVQNRPPQTTYYFRTLFRFAEDPAGAVLSLSHAVDDGAVFYLNGIEIYRYNMPAGPVTVDTVASGGVGAATLLGPFALPPGALLAGDNVLAVEVHQRNSTSDDLAFGMVLDAILTSTNTVTLPPVQLEAGASASVRHSGVLSGRHAWGPLDGVHQVDGELVLAPGSELRLLAGVTVVMGDGASITGDDASIDADGTVHFPVSIRSSSGTNHWGGLGLSGAQAALRLRYADVQGGPVRLFAGAAGFIEQSVLHDYTEGINPIIEAEGASSLLMRDCVVTRYTELHLTATPVQIDGCLFEYPLLDALDIDELPAGSVIRNSTFRHGIGDNIDAIDFGTESRGLIENCWIHDFTDKAISVGDSSREIQVSNTLIHDADRGVGVKDTSTIALDHVTVSRCRVGLDLFEKTAGLGGGLATVSNSIFWDNGLNFGLEPGSLVDCSFSDVAAPLVYPGRGNVSVNPQFVNGGVLDYRLAANSPVASGAEDGGAMGPAFPVGGMPPALLGLTATARSPRMIQVTWGAPATMRGLCVAVERLKPGEAWRLVARLPASASVYLDHDVEPGARYAYRAYLENRIGRSPLSGPNDIQAPSDQDGDGMDDAWELAHQLDPADPDDAAGDLDDDGAANLEEYLAESNPRESRDGLALRLERTPAGQLLLSFPALAGRSYWLQQTEDLAGDEWLENEVWPAAQQATPVQLQIELANAPGRFFRLIMR